MKVDIIIDSKELADEISRKVSASLATILKKAESEDDSILSVKDLAQYLHVSTQWVYERIQLKEIPYSKLGKFPRFQKKKIKQWLNNLETPAMQSLSKPLRRIK